MDRNQAIGLMLMAVLLLLYFQFFSPDPTTTETEPVTEVAADPASTVSENQIVQENILPDSILEAAAREKLGIFAAGADGTEEAVTIENSKLVLTFSTFGGQVANVELKEFKTYKGDPLNLLTAETSRIHQQITANGRLIDLTELYYSTRSWTENDTTYLSFSLPLAGGGNVEHRYAMYPDSYQLGYRLTIDGAGVNSPVRFDWRDDLIKQEKDITLSRTNSTINYYTTSG